MATSLAYQQKLNALAKAAQDMADSNSLSSQHSFLNAMQQVCELDEMYGWLEEVCSDLGINTDGARIDEYGNELRDVNFGAAHPDNPSYLRECLA